LDRLYVFLAERGEMLVDLRSEEGGHQGDVVVLVLVLDRSIACNRSSSSRTCSYR
jgi:hypothetical protein